MCQPTFKGSVGRPMADHHQGWFEANNTGEGGEGGKAFSFNVVQLTEWLCGLNFTLYYAAKAVERGGGGGGGFVRSAHIY